MISIPDVQLSELKPSALRLLVCSNDFSFINTIKLPFVSDFLHLDINFHCLCEALGLEMEKHLIAGDDMLINDSVAAILPLIISPFESIRHGFGLGMRLGHFQTG